MCLSRTCFKTWSPGSATLPSQTSRLCSRQKTASVYMAGSTGTRLFGSIPAGDHGLCFFCPPPRFSVFVVFLFWGLVAVFSPRDVYVTLRSVTSSQIMFNYNVLFYSLLFFFLSCSVVLLAPCDGIVNHLPQPLCCEKSLPFLHLKCLIDWNFHLLPPFLCCLLLLQSFISQLGLNWFRELDLFCYMMLLLLLLWFLP